MHRSRFLAKTTALSVVGVLAALPAFAQTGQQQQIEQLMQQLEIQKKMMDNISRELEQVRAEQAKQTKPTATGGDVEVTTKGGIGVQSKDGNFSFKINGRVQTDYTSYTRDKTELGDGTEFRRVYLSGAGALWDWEYKIEADFANDGVALQDVYLAYRGLKPVTLTVGHFKQPFSLDQLTSDTNVAFMERALPDIFAPGRLISVGANTNGGNWTLAATGGSGSASNDVANEGDEGYALTARATFAPVHEATEVIHLGGAVTWKNPQDEAIRIRQRPESHLTATRFVDTGTIPGKVDDVLTYGAELATVYGPLSLQGEYMGSSVSRAALSTLDFKGWYALVSFFPTGESRKYEANKGIFGRVVPTRSLEDGGFGAWEIALRYSAIDLTDKDVTGGGEKNITLGLNWYANAHVRFLVNYIWVNTDNQATGSSGPLLPGETFRGDDDPRIFMLRAQVDF